MKQIIAILVLFCISHSASAQVWCTPNSQWHFTHSGFNTYGYKQWNYLYDTTIAGKSCQKIRDYSHYVSYQPGPTTTSYTAYIYTHVNNKVVYIKDVVQPGNNAFDTLFNFNAAIGSKWRMAPVSLTNCATSFVTVLDTGRNTIQGQSLKWLKLNYTYNGGFTLTVNDTAYERFGALNRYPYWPGNICPWGTDMDAGGPLRCFSDNQINNYTHTWTAACNYYVTGTAENVRGLSEIKIFPNPAHSDLNIALNQNNIHEVAIFDLLGKEIVSVKNIRESEISINLDYFQKGIYLIQVRDSFNTVLNSKFVRD